MSDEPIYETDVAIDEATREPANGLMVAPHAQQRAITSMTAHTREEIEAFKDTLKAANREMTDAQFRVFMAAANHLGLDPLARQVVPIFQGGRMTVQTTIDGFRLIAERTRKYRGQIGPFWCGPDGEWREVWLGDGPPAAAKVGVIRSDFAEPMWGVARTKSYTKGGNWNAMPDVMIAKVAESLALRKAFPAELSGTYTREELAQGTLDDDDNAVVEAETTTRQQRSTTVPQTRAATAPAAKGPAQEWNPLQDIKLRQALNRLGVRRPDDVKMWIASLRDGCAADGVEFNQANAIAAVELRIAEDNAKRATNDYRLEDLPTGAGVH